jgi:hypothetical protein
MSSKHTTHTRCLGGFTELGGSHDAGSCGFDVVVFDDGGDWAAWLERAMLGGERVRLKVSV